MRVEFDLGVCVCTYLLFCSGFIHVIYELRNLVGGASVGIFVWTFRRQQTPSFTSSSAIDVERRRKRYVPLFYSPSENISDERFAVIADSTSREDSTGGPVPGVCHRFYTITRSAYGSSGALASGGALRTRNGGFVREVGTPSGIVNVTYFPPLFPGLCTVACTHSPCPSISGVLDWDGRNAASLQARPLVFHT